MNISFSNDHLSFVGSLGTLEPSQDDQITRRLAMLLDGQCDLGASKAATKYGFSRQRYYQLLELFNNQGALALALHQTGPKSNYRRTDQAVRLVIRHRFADPDASPHVISQKIRQHGQTISIRSVERIIADFGLQKKTLRT